MSLDRSRALDPAALRRAGGAASRRDVLLDWSARGAALVVTFFFAWVLCDVVYHGVPEIGWSFLTEAPRSGGREGGIAPVIVSTLLILGVCLAATVPLGLMTAIFLSESVSVSGGGRWVRRSLDVLAGVPSIVFGLFGNAFFALGLGLGFSILSGGLTLACMALPLFVRTAEEGLRAVPAEHRLAAAALGLPRVRILWTVILPAAAPGLAVGLALSIGRALAETAALLFTSGYVARMPESLFDSGRTLSVHVYDLAMNVAGGGDHAYATAFVLVVLLLVVDGTASWATDRWLRRDWAEP